MESSRHENEKNLKEITGHERKGGTVGQNLKVQTDRLEYRVGNKLILRKPEASRRCQVIQQRCPGNALKGLDWTCSGKPWIPSTGTK